MEFYRSLKIRIYPTTEQKRQIDCTMDCCRFVYNKMLEWNIKAYRRRGEHLSGYDMQNLLPKMKEYLPWLKEADNRALRCACLHLNAAYRRFFNKNAGFPKFKKKNCSIQSYETNFGDRIKVGSDGVKVPKVGWVRASVSKEIAGKIYSATVIKELNKYYVVVAYKYEKEIQPVEPKKCIGLDYKSNGLYKDSEGNTADMPKWYRLSEKKVAKEQRKLSKKKGSRKGEKRSNNYLKQLKRLRKTQRHIANQRKDYLHKKSTEIANQYDLVAVEDLNLNGIIKLLGKATTDNGYGMFCEMLRYKLEERGKHFVKVSRYFPSSQLCSCCGYKNPGVKDLEVREWVCPECGVIHDRDHNAAINILNEGLRMMTQEQ